MGGLGPVPGEGVKGGASGAKGGGQVGGRVQECPEVRGGRRPRLREGDRDAKHQEPSRQMLRWEENECLPHVENHPGPQEKLLCWRLEDAGGAPKSKNRADKILIEYVLKQFAY